MSRVPRMWWWVIGGVAGVFAVVGLLLFVVLPAGAKTGEAAVLDEIERADANSERILVSQPWGDGELILAAYAREGERRIALAFAIERGRGWRVAAYTEEAGELEDVVVGSLFVAGSEGGEGQPPWSAAVGELGDPRVDEVEVSWASGEKSSAKRSNDAYLVVQEGQTTALDVRYVADDGTEIAKVPVEEAD